MELVYLWVSKFKNIKGKGFNLSSRLKCSVELKQNSENTEKVDKSIFLSIQDERAYTKIFPKDISLTAIVGENGSGKSSLLEIITLLRIGKKVDAFLVYMIDEEYYVLNPMKIPIVTKTGFEIKNLNKNNFWISFFTNGLPDFTDQDNWRHLKTNMHYPELYNGKNALRIGAEYTNINEVYIKYASIYQNYDFVFADISESFRFDKYYIEFDLLRYFELDNVIYKDFLEEVEIFKELERVYFQDISIETISFGPGDEDREANITDADYFTYRFLSFFFFDKYINVIYNIYSELKYNYKIKNESLEKFSDNYLSDFKLAFNISNAEKSIKIKRQLVFISFIAFITGYVKKLKEEFEKNTFLFSFYKDYEKELELINDATHIAEIIKEQFEFFGETNFRTKEYCVRDDKYFSELKKLKIFHSLYLSGRLKPNYVNSQKDNMNYLALSTGEKQMFHFFVNFIYTISNVFEKNYLILFDELDVGLHPNWQKKILNSIFKCLSRIKSINSSKNKKTKFHLLITSHSPFILSDIPTSNVVFLKNGVQENHEIGTFGANIHSLLSNGFFMEGLIGEFARTKINYLIENLQMEKPALSAEEMKVIIEIIGEPFVKAKLMQLYIEKFPIEDEIKRLMDEAAVLKSQYNEKIERINDLKEEKNDNATT